MCPVARDIDHLKDVKGANPHMNGIVTNIFVSFESLNYFGDLRLSKTIAACLQRFVEDIITSLSQLCSYFGSLLLPFHQSNIFNLGTQQKKHCSLKEADLT